MGLLIADAFGRLTLASYFTHCFLLVCQHNKFPRAKREKLLATKTDFARLRSKLLEVCLNALFCKKLIDGRYVFPYISARSRQQRERQYGEVSEWLKEHARKVCIRQRIGVRIPLTAIFEMRACTKVRALYSLGDLYSPPQGDEPPTGVRQLAQPVGQTAHAGGLTPCRASEASQSPSPPYLKKSSYASTGFFFIFSAGEPLEKSQSRS